MLAQTATESKEKVAARALLWRSVHVRRRDVVLASILYSLHQIGESLVPVIVGATVGRAVAQGSWRSMSFWLVVLVVDFAVLSMSFRFGARAKERAKRGTEHQVRMWLTDRVVAPRGSFAEAPGQLLTRTSSDAGKVAAFTGFLPSLIAAGVVLVTSTVLLLRLSLILGVVVLLGTLAQLAAQQRVARLLERHSSAEQDQQGRATVLAENLVRGLRVLKGIGAQRTAADGYAGASRRWARAVMRSASSQSALDGVSSSFSGLYLTLVAAVGGLLALGGHLNLAGLVAALGLARFVVGPIEAVSEASAAYARGLASARRVEEILRPERAPFEPVRDESSYPRSRTLRLREARPTAQAAPLSLTISPGSFTGIVCADPEHADWLVDMLSGDRSAAGMASVGESPLQDIQLDWLRSHVLVGLHDAVLLPGSVRDNLAAVATGPAAIEQAVRACTVDQVIEAVPDGLATDVGDRGERLSGGQQQRVILARALAAESELLVLHDPTTAVDAVTEDAIAGNVHRLRAGRTTLLLTSNPAWLSRCDQVAWWSADEAVVAKHAVLLEREDYRRAVIR